MKTYYTLCLAASILGQAGLHDFWLGFAYSISVSFVGAFVFLEPSEL